MLRSEGNSANIGKVDDDRWPHVVWDDAGLGLWMRMGTRMRIGSGRWIGVRIWDRGEDWGKGVMIGDSG